MTLAVIYVPATISLATYGARCLEHYTAHGYDLAGVTRDLEAARAMLLSRAAGVLLVASAGHVPPDFEPRIEVAGTRRLPVPAHPNVPPQFRRPRRMG